MPSVTSWLRLEGFSSDVHMDVGLQARIHDPLWLLGRQWQVSEFLGEDAGSPVSANLQAEIIELTRYAGAALPQASPPRSQRFNPRTTPLETFVEREKMPVNDQVDLRCAAQTGNEFLRLLDSHAVGKYRPAFLDEYRFTVPEDDARAKLDADSLAWSLLVARKAIDGARLYGELVSALRPAQGAPELPPQPVIEPDDREQVMAAAQTWLTWYESLVSHHQSEASAWLDDRMEYSFTVSAAAPGGELVLTSPEYSEGQLDWYSFVVQPDRSLGSEPGEMRIEEIVRETIPAPVRFPGMPSERWWEFEDGDVDFGSVETSPWDAISLVQLQFAVIFGTDWFVIPLQMPVGSLCHITALKVTDTFGEVTIIPRFSDAGGAGSGWAMFELDVKNPPGGTFSPFAQLLFLPPTLGSSINSAPLEQVSLVRDEMANVAWGIEHVVPSRIGQPLNRRDEYFSRHPQIVGAPALQESEGHTRVNYKLASQVPDYWIPFLPVRNEAGALLLRRGATSAINRDSTPHGRLLEPARLAIHDEEIPRTGVEVTRAYQYARWMDGSTHLWMARRKNVGRGEASSDLRFDFIAPPAPES